ncbi:hypothetical protein DITRI_Ditri13aG0162000 [Diplodiscus trichospermus]
MGDHLEMYFHTSSKDVNHDLKEIIYSHLLEKRKKYQDNGILNERGRTVLYEKRYLADTDWSISEVEFTHSLLLWHIATDLALYDDRRKFRSGTLGPYCQISKLLSDYMMYLLFLCPAMLPEGIGNIRHRDSCIEATNFFVKKLDSKEALEACLGIDRYSRSFFVELGSVSKSTLFEGCLLADQLQALVYIFRLDHKEKWEIIGQVWLNMLTYAASKCSWKEHSRQLQHGEELLTHVALLMAHLGLTKKINLADLPERLKDFNFNPTWYWNKLDRLAYYLA